VLANPAAAAYHRSMLLAPDVAPPPAIIRGTADGRALAAHMLSP
jgi:hypothetical protein